jgi:hypothetical protein
MWWSWFVIIRSSLTAKRSNYVQPRQTVCCLERPQEKIDKYSIDVLLIMSINDFILWHCILSQIEMAGIYPSLELKVILISSLGHFLYKRSLVYMKMVYYYA